MVLVFELATDLTKVILMKASHSTSLWRNITVFNDDGVIVKSYPLDEKARHLTKIQRQKRRNLWRMTGKHGFSLGKMQEEMKALDCVAPQAGSNQASQNQTTSGEESDEYVSLSKTCATHLEGDDFDVTSIEWLLNPRPQISAQ